MAPYRRLPTLPNLMTDEATAVAGQPPPDDPRPSGLRPTDSLVIVDVEHTYDHGLATKRGIDD